MSAAGAVTSLFPSAPVYAYPCAYAARGRRLAMLRSDLVACAPTIAVPLMRQLRALLGRRLRKKLHMHILISAELKPTATGISPSLTTAGSAICGADSNLGRIASARAAF